jgi:hypothetical protein
MLDTVGVRCARSPAKVSGSLFSLREFLFKGAAQYLRSGAQHDFEFVGSRPPQDAQLGAWEVDFPPGVFSPEQGQTVSAWALDFSRGGVFSIICRVIVSFRGSLQLRRLAYRENSNLPVWMRLPSSCHAAPASEYKRFC